MLLTRSFRRFALPMTALAFLAAAPSALADSTSDLQIFPAQLEGGTQTSPGEVGTYTYTVFNLGPDATEPTVIDTLGDAEELVSVSSTKGQCTQGTPVVCSLGKLEPADYAQISVQVRFTKVSALNTHQVQVTGAEGNVDPDPSNNQGSTPTPISEKDDGVDETPEITTGSWFRTQSTLKVDADASPYGDGEVFFEYGKTTKYGSKTASKKISGDQERKVEIKITGLKMNTLYHYRAVLVVDGKTYRGKTAKARTLGKLKYGPLTLKAEKRGAASTTYSGKLGDGFADAPGACKGTITITVYTLANVDLLQKKTKMNAKTCTFKITIPFGSQQARKHGKKGFVLVQAHFSGNDAVSLVGSESDRGI